MVPAFVFLIETVTQNLGGAVAPGLVSRPRFALVPPDGVNQHRAEEERPQYGHDAPEAAHGFLLSFKLIQRVGVVGVSRIGPPHRQRRMAGGHAKGRLRKKKAAPKDGLEVLGEDA